MEKCFFEVGKKYVDMYRNEFTVTEIRPYYPHKSTFDGEVYECPEYIDNYYEIFTDKPHTPFCEEKFAEKYESFEQGSIRYEKLVEINKNPSKKDFICVVPGAYVICDRNEYDKKTHDLMEYAIVGSWGIDYKHMDKLTKEEKEKVMLMAETVFVKNLSK